MALMTLEQLTELSGTVSRLVGMAVAVRVIPMPGRRCGTGGEGRQLHVAARRGDPVELATAYDQPTSQFFSSIERCLTIRLGREGPVGDDRALGVLGFRCVAERLRFGHAGYEGWRDGPMADAGRRQNDVLAALLARAQWSPENLGVRLNALAVRLGIRARLHPKSPVRWVRTNAGHPVLCVPREPWPELVCLLLRQQLNEPVTPELLGWPANRGLRYVAANDGLSQPWDGTGAIAALGEVVDADSMERRHFMTVTGLTLTAVAHQWLGDPARVAAAVTGQRVDHALVGNLEQVAQARRLMDDAVGGGGLLPAVREDLRLVVAMLRNSAYTEEVGQRLHAVAAEFGRLAGWLAFDSGQPAIAQRYFLAALRAAHVSGDRALGANILGFMTFQAACSEQAKDAIPLGEAALRGARYLSPGVEAATWARLARGAAYAGEFTTWRRAQDRAFDLLTRSVPENEPPWIYWFTEPHAHGIAGQSLLTLGRPRQAEPHLRDAVALLAPGFTRERAEWLCWLATARVSAGSVEQGCATAREAATIIRRLDSPRVQHQLTEFRQAAAPYVGSTAVREFDADYRDLLPRN